MWPFATRLRRLRSNPLPKYWARVHVTLESSSTVMRTGDTFVSYFRNFGIACGPSELKRILASLVTDGEIEWSDTTWEQIDLTTLERHIQKTIEPVPSVGVWYASGRTFHGPGSGAG